MLDSGESQKEVIRPDFNRAIMIDFHGATISSDTAFILLREVDERFRIIDPMKDCLEDLRSPAHTKHALVQMLRQRVYQIAAGYEDCNDADYLRLLETPNALELFRFVAQKLLKMTLGCFEKPFLETLGAGHIVWYSPRGLQETCGRLNLQVMDWRPSLNYTKILFDRFKHLSFPSRWSFQAATAIMNYSAAPLGRPNQMLAALRFI